MLSWQTFLILTSIAQFSSCFPSLSSIQGSGLNRQFLISIQPKDQSQLELVDELIRKNNVRELGDRKGSLRPVLIALEAENTAILTQLKFLSIPYKTFSNDVRKFMAEQRAGQRMSYRASRSNWFDNYHPYSQIMTYLKRIAENNPGIVRKIDMGLTVEARKIEALAFSAPTSAKNSTPNSKPAILIDCGIHAREWISLATCLFIINELIMSSNNSKLLDNYILYIVPLLNPDGYAYSWSHNRMWRKNRTPLSENSSSSSCIGVDLNRNFPANFCQVGASTDPCSHVYCGPNPFSELESQALQKLMKLIKDQHTLKAYFTLHSFGQGIFCPFGYGSKVASNKDQLHKLGSVAAEAIRKTHGSNYTVGQTAICLEPASGGSDDWAFESVNSCGVYNRDERRRGI